MRTRTFFAALGAFALATGSTALAQGEWANQLNTLLGQVGTAARQQGRSQTHATLTGSLDAGSANDQAFYLNSGTEYEIIAVCAAGCTDLDIALFDPQGNLLQQDLLADDVPVLIQVAPTSGNFKVRVRMVECTSSPCHYGLVVYGPGTTPALSAGDDQWAKEVRGLFGMAAASLGLMGLQSLHDPHVGALRTGESFTMSFRLKQGIGYHFVGLGDHDCTDLDLTLYDPQDNVVASDLLQDKSPVISITPATTGLYKIKISMVACTDPPCRYGLGIYSGVRKTTDRRTRVRSNC